MVWYGVGVCILSRQYITQAWIQLKPERVFSLVILSKHLQNLALIFSSKYQNSHKLYLHESSWHEKVEFAKFVLKLTKMRIFGFSWLFPRSLNIFCKYCKFLCRFFPWSLKAFQKCITWYIWHFNFGNSGLAYTGISDVGQEKVKIKFSTPSSFMI